MDFFNQTRQGTPTRQYSGGDNNPNTPKTQVKQAHKGLSLLCGVALGALFASPSVVHGFSATNTNATFNNGWSYAGVGNSQSGAPRTNQNNSFDYGTARTAPALTVIGGTADLHNESTGSLNNSITGGMTVESGGWAYLRNSGSGSLTNTITGGMTVNGGGTYLYNSGSGSLTNTITGGLTVNGGDTYLYNSGSGSMSTTIDTVNLSITGSSSDGLLLGGGPQYHDH